MEKKKKLYASDLELQRKDILEVLGPEGKRTKAQERFYQLWVLDRIYVTSVEENLHKYSARDWAVKIKLLINKT